MCIHDFAKEGGGGSRAKVADVGKRSYFSKVSYLWLGCGACLSVLEALGFSMINYASATILEILFLSFEPTS